MASLDKALKDMINKELKKALSKMRYNVDARIVGVDQVFRIILPFPPYAGLKLKVKEKDDSYLRGKIIDIEWDVDRQVFNAIFELY